MIIEGLFVHHDRILRHQVACNFKRSTRRNIPIIEKIAPKIGTADFYFDDNVLIFPAFIDIHVHAREDTGKTQNYKEDFNSVSAAAINGGVAAIIDMPNNKTSPPVNEFCFNNKLKLLQNSNSQIPIALYAGINESSYPFYINYNNQNNELPYKFFMLSSYKQVEEILSRYKGKSITFHAEDINYFLNS
ncbi:MAG: amidohydrolase family protein, partial [Oligoflexia bacterium]|nr:amidohydrolase family protein [Oligoflexia bacterium]